MSNRILFTVLAWIACQLVITGYWHRENNYGIRPGNYSLHAISAGEFQQLPAERQKYWTQQEADQYLQVTIKQPFIFRHIRDALIPILAVALGSYLAILFSASRTRVFR